MGSDNTDVSMYESPVIPAIGPSARKPCGDTQMNRDDRRSEIGYIQCPTRVMSQLEANAFPCRDLRADLESRLVAGHRHLSIDYLRLKRLFSDAKASFRLQHVDADPA